MLEAELQLATRIAREAGALILDIYATDFDVVTKADSSPVTVADQRANAHIVSALAAQFPEDGIVAEEDEEHRGAVGRRRCWYVDPLDGTREFVKRNGEFAVMLGLAIDGNAQLGVVYQPTTDKLYAGVVGQGASLTEGGRTRELQVAAVAQPSELRLVVSRSHRSDAVDQLVRALGIDDERSSGSVGLKVGLIAERKADLYVHVSDRACKWDACGPEAIVRAAGGAFTDLAGDPFVYAGTDVRNRRGIFASNGAAHPTALPAVRRVGQKAGLV